MRRHILPNVLADRATRCWSSLAPSSSRRRLFVGLGDQLAPSWGQILAFAQASGAPGIGAWWYTASPGIAIVLVVLSFTLVGNALDSILEAGWSPMRRRRRPWPAWSPAAGPCRSSPTPVHSPRGGDLRVRFSLAKGGLTAVDGVSFRLDDGEALGSPASPGVARRRPLYRSSSSCRRTAASSPAASSCTGSISPRSPKPL